MAKRKNRKGVLSGVRYDSM